MAAKIGKLSIGLVTGVTNERFHTRVYMHVLLESGRRAELFAALGTRVSGVIGVNNRRMWFHNRRGAFFIVACFWG